MQTRIISIEEAVFGENDAFAAKNRDRLGEHGVAAINVMSAPGSGKTQLLARTLRDLAPFLRCAVVVGDIATDNDARRLSDSGAEAIQITTNGYCHLDASMIARSLDALDLESLDLLIIENVGNMVCPATFDLGEGLRVAVMSVTEGEDKPLKYPLLFKRADAIVLNKMDIAEAVGYDRCLALANLAQIAPTSAIFELSARTGEGVDQWSGYLRSFVIDSSRCHRRGTSAGRPMPEPELLALIHESYSI